MLTVHHLGLSQSERVFWLCEELGLEYELKIYKRSPLLAPPSWLHFANGMLQPQVSRKMNMRMSEVPVDNPLMKRSEKKWQQTAKILMTD